VLPEFKAITVAYADGGTGKTQKRLLATSRLSYGVGSTLGRAETISPTRARCAVVNGRLEPVLSPRTDPECPLVTDEMPRSCAL
jgi:hypothetical protein